MGTKSERVGGQKSLHTAGGSAGYVCSAKNWTFCVTANVPAVTL
jgi:hypothetical protein